MLDGVPADETFCAFGVSLLLSRPRDRDFGGPNADEYALSFLPWLDTTAAPAAAIGGITRAAAVLVLFPAFAGVDASFLSGRLRGLLEVTGLISDSGIDGSKSDIVNSVSISIISTVISHEHGPATATR